MEWQRVVLFLPLLFSYGMLVMGARAPKSIFANTKIDSK